MTKPKPCPFCGVAPEKEQIVVSAGAFVWIEHPVNDCALSGLKFPFDVWERRVPLRIQD